MYNNRWVGLIGHRDYPQLLLLLLFYFIFPGGIAPKLTADAVCSAVCGCCFPPCVLYLVHAS